MPRLIDHEKRDREIGHAAMRVLARDGLRSLSVRKVADEAGIAVASLRRAFPTQDALRLFCLTRIQAAVTDRISAITGDGLATTLAILRELLPGDEVRCTELTAQIQLGSLALTDERLQPAVRELSDAVLGVCGAALADLARTGELSKDLDLGYEAERLHALLDGLALHLLWNPIEGGEQRALTVLEHHLKSLDTRGD